MSTTSSERSLQLRLLRSLVLPSVPGTRPATLKSVLKLIDEYSSLRDGECWASQERLADDLGLSTATLRRSLKALQLLGVLSCQRRSRGGKITINHYVIEWKALEAMQPLSDEPVMNDRSPCPDQSLTVSRSIVHHEPQEEKERKEKTTTAAVVDSLADIANQLRELISRLSDRLASVLHVGTNSPEKPRKTAPSRLSSDWRTVERELAELGIRYPSKAVEACRMRGDSVHDVRSIVRRDGLTTTAIASRLIHGTKLPESRKASSSAESQPTATDLWERFCGYCKSRSLDRNREFWRFESAIEKAGLTIPNWLKLEAVA